MSRILIAGGGTAGHVVPALALADVLTARGYEVHFCGGPRGMESTLVPAAGYPFSTVRVRGFERRFGLTTLKTIASLPVAAADAAGILRRLRPACVIGVGAYASGPVVAEAALAGIPSAVVEMDAHMGWTNDLLSRMVDRVFLSFPLDRPVRGRRSGKFEQTGRPLRPELLAARREDGLARFGLSGERPVVVIFGGSLGARTLNEATLAAFAEAPTLFDLVHVTGEKDYERVAAAKTEGDNPHYQIFPYLQDFPLALAAADLAVSRAGGSVAELLARGVPAILVPYPMATGDHQTQNARALASAGAAVVVPDAEMSGPRLAAEVDRLLDPERREAMREKALQLARPDAASHIADQVVHLAGPPVAASHAHLPAS